MNDSPFPGAPSCPQTPGPSRAGTSPLIQSQSIVIVSHSLKGLFAFFGIQPWTKPIQANAVHPISVFKKKIYLYGCIGS